MIRDDIIEDFNRLLDDHVVWRRGHWDHRAYKVAFFRLFREAYDAGFFRIRGRYAVTGPRLPALPDVPGIGETVKGFEFTNWWGFLAPAGTPAAAIARLNEEFTAIAALPETRERLSALGLAAQSSTPQQFTDLIRTEQEKVSRIVKEASIKLE